MPRSFLVLVALLAIAAGSVKGQDYAGPPALGPFRVDRDVSVDSLFQRLGRPSSTAENHLCYRSSDGTAFLVLTRMTEDYGPKIAGGVVLSTFRNCVNRLVTVTPDDLAAWKTAKGIGLSSTADDVRKAYGTPLRVDKVEGDDYRRVIYGDFVDNHYVKVKRPELGDTVLVYGRAPDDLRIAEFGIREGRVVWIFLSKNE